MAESADTPAAESTADRGAAPRSTAQRAPAKTAAAAAGTSTRAPRTRTTAAKPRTTARTKAPSPQAQPQQAPAVAVEAPAKPLAARPTVLAIHGVHKRYGDIVAVDGVTLDIAEGSFYGIVGPNGAGKTTTLSIVTGLLRPDAGRVVVHGVDVWTEPVRAKHIVGVLPDKLRLFDRLTGAQFLRYAGTLRGLSAKTVRARTTDLAAAFGIEDALDRLVADYSAGMTKKIALAAAMIHSPRVLVLDEPFESVDPVSAANIIDILQRYTAAGGTVVVSSHGMDMIQRVCDSVAIIVRGQVLASGTIDEVRGEQTLEERFVDLAGGRKAAEGMEWLHSFSD
ncbi:MULTISPECIES: ABC transporter ATP-binding protein [unclassified Leifsonia]|uniref:ABC transporter ATP-binding protein n=1 Tax=unclassified Leifsonia TaxID=2663824 RepID=UPI0008A72D8F|nr:MULTISPECIES: ABC transporter ATP-binding protein [unclassified Leifsonia]SEH75809.1 ABC-2 type transport system ATP-binding protein [Leifsonia sp. CL154]SFL37338.1 ABC-2 type transport system ATP-binding protein [Leifsonia sp. CL147]